MAIPPHSGKISYYMLLYKTAQLFQKHQPVFIHKLLNEQKNKNKIKTQVQSWGEVNKTLEICGKNVKQQIQYY